MLKKIQRRIGRNSQAFFWYRTNYVKKNSKKNWTQFTKSRMCLSDTFYSSLKALLFSRARVGSASE